MAAVQLTRTHKILIGVVVAGAVVIAGIGFAGSYTAVRELAVQKDFGDFSYFFPIGIDAGICVLLALDLLLTWIRIPFPLLRQTAWLLTAATIAFNGAAAWPDPLGVGMHAVIPVLFVVTVEAARHAVGRIADITADKHMEGVRITRWLLSPLPTFRLWRRMKLWEIRSYERVIKLEQYRLVYEAQLQAQYGRNWRRKAPVESLMPLRLAKYGVPLTETAPHVLEEAGLKLGSSMAMEAQSDKHMADIPTADEHQRGLDSGPSGTAGHAERQAGGEVHDELAAATQQDVTAVGHAVAAQVTDGPPAAPAMTDDRASAVDEHGVHPDSLDVMKHSVSEPHPFFEPSTPQAFSTPPASTVPEQHFREPVPTAPTVGKQREAGGIAVQTSLDLPPTQSEPTLGSPTWGPTDPGTATAAAPLLEQTDEPEVTSVQQEVEAVAAWLAEAEETGERLSGAEVARRLNVSPRTGQRRLDKATAYLTEQRRTQGRAHLRSVRS
ncbi:DUF2637 domain-containing protein [Streptomyces sp. CB02261]|uniref:DUF2637 domain-containing protein n=1 Tax=Streptomyces sp. CB02261 TaxID=1703940 RepID=UPI00093B0846|nr:DUF2637 domain-containing protein [Streptomyces sp. CB02261]OKJ52589.1 hypothetical protein AMK29_30675 [Streptomyces sp. CB02261]